MTVVSCYKLISGSFCTVERYMTDHMYHYYGVTHTTGSSKVMRIQHPHPVPSPPTLFPLPCHLLHVWWRDLSVCPGLEHDQTVTVNVYGQEDVVTPFQDKVLY